MPPRRPFPWSVVIAALVVATVTCSPALREDEFKCEEAVVHLKECCPGFSKPAAYCRYDNACGSIFPALTLDDSSCIPTHTCESLIARGICARADKATPRTSSSKPAPVCP